MMGFRKAEIHLRIQFPMTGTVEERRVEAFVVGSMAVHKEYNAGGWVRGAYVVTHLPSGTLIQTGMTEKEARAFAVALDPFDACWASVPEGTTKHLSPENKQVLRDKRRFARRMVLGIPA